MSRLRTFYIGPRGAKRPRGFDAHSREEAFALARESWGNYAALRCYGSREKRGGR